MDVSSLGALGRHGWLVLGLSLLPLSCAQGPSENQEEPTPSVEQAYREASQRLVNGFLEGGWVVSRTVDGSPEHMGEGLIWTGIAMGDLPCDLGTALESTLASMVARHFGALVRIEPLGEYESGREVTLDGALGLYYGIAQRVVRCGTGELWAPVIARHLGFLTAHGGRLHQNVDAKLIPHFDFVLDLLAHRLGVGPSPDSENQRRLEGEIITWAAAVVATKAAAYRVNLGLLALQTIETLGGRIGDEGRWQLCAVTKGIDIPTLDHWCGRQSIVPWIEGYQFNQWEYRHQRSGSWESPDADGDFTPGLDLIVAYRMGYSLTK